MKKTTLFSVVICLFISINIFPQDSSPNTFQFSITVPSGWAMLSIPGLLPGGPQTPDRWWAYRSIWQLFVFNSGYQPLTGDLQPTHAFWVKHSTARTYNTGDEWPSWIDEAPHLPCPVLVGWNQIGVYECPVAVNEITTTPPGMITSSFYKFDGTYTAVDTLYPGWGYWIKMTSNGYINFPSCNELKTNNIESGERPLFKP